MMECNNKCKGNEILCQFCQENFEVSDCFYTARRENHDAIVTGYVVKNKKTGKIEGILNAANDFNELAFVEVNTICLAEKGANT